MPDPTMMQAAWYERPGPAEEVLQVGQLPLPEPAPGEVRVRLRLSGINPGDIKKRTAWKGAALAHPLIIPHSDGAGTIDAVGPGVDTARCGERVWVHGAQSYRAFGTAAQYTCVPSDLAVPLPPSVREETGACLGIPGITAHRAVHAGGPVRGQRVLVHGVLGAVSSMAAQLAVRAGARVVGTVRRGSQREQVTLPGLAGVVALDDPSAARQVVEIAGGKVHRIIEVDLAGNLPLDQQVIANGGTIAAYGSHETHPRLDFWPLLFDNVVFRLLGSDDFPAQAKQKAARELTAAAADGQLTVGHVEV
ncbi:NADPH:quinone reductase [Luteococcus sp.]|uniref:NADPH:quinone reductase n=1 Tax=Luteococcus sp. TaxID=1969402 RepID=UPI003736788A